MTRAQSHAQASLTVLMTLRKSFFVVFLSLVLAACTGAAWCRPNIRRGCFKLVCKGHTAGWEANARQGGGVAFDSFSVEPAKGGDYQW
jgi:hypothetical protein